MPSPLDLVTDPVSLALFALFGCLFLWERLAPARPLPTVSGWGWRAALAFVVFFFGSSYLPLVLGERLAALRVVDASHVGTIPGALLALLVYEAIAYAWHRALHAFGPLWLGLHQMHHSAERLDVPSAFWFHPLDVAGWAIVTTLSLTLVGVSSAAATVFVLVSTFLAVLQHTNVRTPTWLGYLVQRPENHSHHHARGVHAGNYANVSLFDIVFGTFENHADFAEEIGFGEGASLRVAAMLAAKDVGGTPDVSDHDRPRAHA